MDSSTFQVQQEVQAKRRYTTPTFTKYGSLSALTLGQPGSRADGQGSTGSGNQGGGGGGSGLGILD